MTTEEMMNIYRNAEVAINTINDPKKFSTSDLVNRRRLQLFLYKRFKDLPVYRTGGVEGPNFEFILSEG